MSHLVEIDDLNVFVKNEVTEFHGELKPLLLQSIEVFFVRIKLHSCHQMFPIIFLVELAQRLASDLNAVHLLDLEASLFNAEVRPVSEGFSAQYFLFDFWAEANFLLSASVLCLEEINQVEVEAAKFLELPSDCHGQKL